MSHMNDSFGIWTRHGTRWQECWMGWQWLSHFTYEFGMSHVNMNASCHIWTSHLTYERGMSWVAKVCNSVGISWRNSSGSHMSQMNEPYVTWLVPLCHVICAWVISWSSKDTEYDAIAAAVICHIWTSHIARFREDETRNGHRNAKRNPRWSSQVSFQTSHLKRELWWFRFAFRRA